MLEGQRLSYRRQLTAPLAVALCLLGAPAVAAAADGAVAALAAEGQFAQAYQRLRDEGRSGDPAALRALSHAALERALRSPDTFERWAGLRAARGVADRALAEAARAQLHGDSRYEEALALEILARGDPEGGRDAFVAALDSPYRTVRLRALRALQPRRDDALVTRLAILATADADPDIRVLAIRTLAQWGAGGAVASLRRAVDDPVAAVQQEAVRALVALGDDEVAALVRERLAHGAPETRVASLRLARLVPAPELLDAIGPYLADPDPEVRVAAAAAVLAITRAAPAPS